MKASEITKSGFYWRLGPAPVWRVVEVAPLAPDGWRLMIFVSGLDTWEELSDATGEFFGPIEPPRLDPGSLRQP